MDFKNAEELLALCIEQHLSIADVMRKREVSNTSQSPEQVEHRMLQALKIMYDAAHEPLETGFRPVGHLIGKEAFRLEQRGISGNSLLGNTLMKAMVYAQAVLEVNASMGLIVAAPTAGSSGVIPAVLFALQEAGGLTEKQLLDGLFTAGAIGYLLMRNASVSGAEAGCQAEIGSASAMAAAAMVAMQNGTATQCLDAASIALSNLLGLVCDPVAGLVEVPCQSRNALGAANALICGEMALSGIPAAIPFTEMAEAMYKVGKSLPESLRETALGGCAATCTGCAIRTRIFEQ